MDEWYIQVKTEAKETLYRYLFSEHSSDLMLGINNKYILKLMEMQNYSQILTF